MKVSPIKKTVLMSIMSKAKNIFNTQNTDVCSFQKLDNLGLSIFLGGVSGGINLGMDVVPFYSDVKGVVLNVNKSTNNITILTNSDSDDRFRLMFLRYQDISLKTFFKLPCIANASVIIEVIDLLESLLPHNKLIIHDSLCQYYVDHPLLRLIFLRSLRPVESFYFHLVY